MAVNFEDEAIDMATLPQVSQPKTRATTTAVNYNGFPSTTAPAQNEAYANLAKMTPGAETAGVMSQSSTAAAAAVTAGQDVLVENTNTDWVNKKWRPMMGWVYMATCTFDFIVAPILWSVAQALSNNGVVANQWQPLTLQGAGLYHVALGAVLGITAYGRSKEKMAEKA